MTSMWTTTVAKPASLATCTLTATGSVEPSALTARVHRTTEVARGSPDATPCGKRNVPATGPPSGLLLPPPPQPGIPARAAPATNQPAPRRKSLRFMRAMILGSAGARCDRELGGERHAPEAAQL